MFNSISLTKKVRITRRVALLFSALLFVFLPCFSTTAFAACTQGDWGCIISQLPQTTISKLPQSFITNPSTASFANLSQSQITSVLNVRSITTYLPPNTFSSIASISTGSLSGVLTGLSSGVLRGLPSTLFSGLPSSTISGLLSGGANGLSTGVLRSLGGSLLSGFTGTDLSGMLNGLSTSVLGSLPSTLFSGLSTSALTGLLSGGVNGLSSSALQGLGGSLLGSLSGGQLTDLFSGLSPEVLGSLDPSMFSEISPEILSSLPDSITSLFSGDVSSFITDAIGDIAGDALGIGLYVPVHDAGLTSKFKAYAKEFTKYHKEFTTYASDMKKALTGAPDSLRDIIAGGSPGGVAAARCATGPAVNNPAFAYQDPPGPWANAIASSTEAQDQLGITIDPQIPDSIDVQVNTSGSLRCILQDLVGYQKISLFVQIQSMLKQYIADVQQQQLKNQLLSQMSAASLNWSKQGNVVNNYGTVVTESVYDQNPTQSQYSNSGRIVNTLVNQAAAAEGDPIGSLGLNDPLYVATQVAMNMRDQTEDPRNSLTEKTKATLTNDEINACMDDMNAENCPGGGAYFALGDMFQNIQNTPLGALAIVQDEAQRRVEQDKERLQQEAQGSGFKPTKKCSGLESDPGCDPALMVDVSPSGQNEKTVTDAAASGNQQIADATSIDTNASVGATAESLDLNTGESGLSGYDTTALQSAGTNVNLLINELYRTIQYAYFDSTDNQKNWAQAALLSIYDEMNFDTTKPATQLPQINGSDGSEQDFTY